VRLKRGEGNIGFVKYLEGIGGGRSSIFLMNRFIKAVG
jgi:hypothetical protein